MQQSCSLRIAPDRTDLRSARAAFMRPRTPALLDRWIREIGSALHIPSTDWPRIKDDQTAAVDRWADHILDPSNIQTYLFLRRHARRGFISHFPASRFLVAQMRLVHLLMDDLRREHADDPARAEELCALLGQEFGVRTLHITHLFLEAREEQLPEQEAR